MSSIINCLLFLQFPNQIFATALQAVSTIRKLAQSVAHLKNRRKGQFSMMTFA
jgi:hypothetical protein